MAGFWRPVAEKHSRRYSHAGMQAWEENNISFKDSLILNKCSLLGIWRPRTIFHSTLNSKNLEMGTNGAQTLQENWNAEIIEFPQSAPFHQI